jgi:hypothetical protein
MMVSVITVLKKEDKNYFFLVHLDQRISANQSILLALAAIMNIRLERKTVTL